MNPWSTRSFTTCRSIIRKPENVHHTKKKGNENNNKNKKNKKQGENIFM